MSGVSLAEYGRRSVVGMGLVGGVALALGGCASLLGGKRQEDDRFEKFSEYVPEDLEIKTDLGPLEKRMPGIRLSSAHWVAQYQQEKREMLPYPDRPLWVNAVLTLDPESTKALAAAASGAADRLPGIYPDLRQYVPKGNVFAVVSKEKADEILDVDNMVQDDSNATGTDQFGTDKVAVCADSNLLILIATEHQS